MKLYFSYMDLPELAPFLPRQRRIIWINFVLESEKSERNKRLENRLVASIIFGLLTGAIVGGMVGTNVERGCAIGAMIGIVFPLFILHFVHLHSVRPHLRAYIESSDFSALPINEKAKLFLDPLRPRK